MRERKGMWQKWIPTYKQWKKWSLPSKYSAIALIITIGGLFLTFLPYIQNNQSLTATEYVVNVRWYLDAEATAKALPKDYKRVLDKQRDLFREQLLINVKNSFGEASKEHRIVESVGNDVVKLYEAMLEINQFELLITDNRIIFQSSGAISEMHNPPKKITNRICTNSSSFEIKQTSGEILSVSQKGIVFLVPSKEFVEYTNCKADRIKVEFLPSTANIQGDKLVLKNPGGWRLSEMSRGKKIVRRVDSVNYYVLEKKNRY